MTFALLALALAASPAEPKMKISVVKLAATEQKAAVSRVLQQQLEPLKGCYDLALKDEPGLEGELSLKVVLGGRGSTPEDVTVDEASTLKSSTAASCVKARFLSTEWPAPKKRAEISVTLKFAVAPAGR